MKNIIIAIASGMAFTLTLSASAENDVFPEKPVRLVVPFGAGGGTDGLARAVQKAIDENNLLSEPLVVANADGAGGAVGSRQVLKSDPDGYTILQIHQEMFAASAIDRVNYTPQDFEPIIQVSEACMFVAVPEDSEFNSFEELMGYASENSDEFRQADDIGAATHFPSAQLMKEVGVTWPIVPTGATSARFSSLMGGFTNMALMSPLWVEKGRGEIKGLAVLSEERYDFEPDMPTAKELGYNVTSCLNRRYWAPKGTPQERIDVLADAIESASDTEQVRNYLESTGEKLKVVRGEELRSLVEEEYESFVDVSDVVKGAR